MCQFFVHNSSLHDDKKLVKVATCDARCVFSLCIRHITPYDIEKLNFKIMAVEFITGRLY